MPPKGSKKVLKTATRRKPAKKTGTAAKRATRWKAATKAAKPRSRRTRDDEPDDSLGGSSDSSHNSSENDQDESDDEVVNCLFSPNDAWRTFEQGMFDTLTDKEGIQEDFAEIAKPLTQGELEELLPERLPDSAFNSDWTQEDESALLDAWETDERRTNPYKTDGTMTMCFKVLIRIFREPPIQIISPKYRLVWERQQQGVGLHWSTRFCTNLRDLAMHPIWEQNIKLFAAAMQYAVILRTCDRRTWQVVFEAPPSKDAFWITFAAEIERSLGKNLNVAKIHARVRKRIKKNGQSIPNISRFFSALEAIIPDDLDDAIAENSSSVSTYPIGTGDLSNITKALDSTTYLGMPIFYPTALISTYVLGALGNSQDDPPTVEDTPKYVARSWLAVRRDAAKARKRSEAGSPDHSRSDELLSDQLRSDESQPDEFLKNEIERLRRELRREREKRQDAVDSEERLKRELRHETEMRRRETEMLRRETEMRQAAEERLRELELNRGSGSPPPPSHSSRDDVDDDVPMAEDHDNCDFDDFGGNDYGGDDDVPAVDEYDAALEQEMEALDFKPTLVRDMP
ncbi:hypothetical protein Cob_v012669 [Colletotrichum orbiculare MAFF 240422]|uniref:Uncharacterized protein n=1 Tax=Colletotrichum orbiculare (strain 104-T / ATCC 96160 / CBS 514.97 / LARS 414 / MAFF 240422) TaxID=1213857 RepID=N4UVK3_COLOR|nr:hypothetical protein Cob_v012669 [Colletotrichum orbiculare MAFF 240422]